MLSCEVMRRELRLEGFEIGILILMFIDICYFVFLGFGIGKVGFYRETDFWIWKQESWKYMKFVVKNKRVE